MESAQHREPWNKGKLVGQKPPLKPKDIWAIRIQLQNAHQFPVDFCSEMNSARPLNLLFRRLAKDRAQFARGSKR